MIIYKITNLVDKKLYIGQTIGSLKDRWNQHLSPRSCCIKLKNAIQTHGKENFVIEQIDSANNIDELNRKEEFWIKELNTIALGYNLIEGGYNRKPSQETRLKRSRSMMGKNKGPKKPGHIEKLADLKRGVKQPLDIVQKRSESNRKKIVDCSTGIVYQSVKEAGEHLNLKRPNISTHLKGRSSNCGGRVFKYLADWDGILLPLMPLGYKIRNKYV